MKPYQFENLILLMGTNPLPNYVIADYFLQENQNISKIWLIYSKENNLQGGTLTYAENLEKIISHKWKKVHPSLEFPLEKVGLSDVSRAMTIQSEIKKSRLKEGAKEASFHLNYTGGTKSMSTHIYWILRDFSKEEIIGNISFSYLDARNFRLVSDDDNQIIENDLRKKICLPFEDMIGLHGYQIVTEKKNTEKFEKAAQIFEEYVDHNTTKERRNKIKQCEEGGKWLEVYIANKLEQKKLEHLTKEISTYVEIRQNISMKHPKWAGGRSNFEMDVMVVYGYQLTGISCTVQDVSMKCKQKGFEVILRSKQIGGDESKSILITGSDKYQTELLQQQLIVDTGGNTKNIKVFGIEDLRREKYFFKELKRFIFTE